MNIQHYIATSHTLFTHLNGNLAWLLIYDNKTLVLIYGSLLIQGRENNMCVQ